MDKYELVKFDNGKYGICVLGDDSHSRYHRKGAFVDLKSTEYSWNIGTEHHSSSCQGSERIARRVLETLSPQTHEYKGVCRGFTFVKDIEKKKNKKKKNTDAVPQKVKNTIKNIWQ